MKSKINLGVFSSHDLVGQRFNGYNLLEGISEERFNKAMFVINKTSSEDWVHSIKPTRKLMNFTYRATNKISDILGLESMFSVGGVALTRSELFKSLDVLHLELLHNGTFFSFLSLPEITSWKPTIWTLHDCWPFTGMCIHPMECEGWMNGCKQICPHPRGTSIFRHITPGLLYSAKNYAYKRSNMTLVVASDWMKNKIMKSPLMNFFNLEKIPFGVDEKVFYPHSRVEARGKLNIELNSHVISFRGVSKKFGYSVYPYKGTQYLVEALEMYQPVKPTTLVIFEDPTDYLHLSEKYQLINIPWAEQDEVIDVLSASDLFMMPSLYESFGMMAVEAMACGTPVIGFTDTPLEETVNDGEGGRIVKRRDSTKLANAMAALLGDIQKLDQYGLMARRRAEKYYTSANYVYNHIHLYESVIELANKKINDD